jgi:hypothetical protein
VDAEMLVWSGDLGFGLDLNGASRIDQAQRVARFIAVTETEDRTSASILAADHRLPPQLGLVNDGPRAGAESFLPSILQPPPS